jgi:hypothetical protein
MKKCSKCGTYEVFSMLIPVADRLPMWRSSIPADLFECEDENECLRREQMKMGPAVERPELVKVT